MRNARSISKFLLFLLFFWIFVILQPCAYALAAQQDVDEVTSTMPCHNKPEIELPDCCDGAGMWHEGISSIQIDSYIICSIHTTNPAYFIINSPSIDLSTFFTKSNEIPPDIPIYSKHHRFLI